MNAGNTSAFNCRKVTGSRYRDQPALLRQRDRHQHLREPVRHRLADLPRGSGQEASTSRCGATTSATPASSRRTSGDHALFASKAGWLWGARWTHKRLPALQRQWRLTRGRRARLRRVAAVAPSRPPCCRRSSPGARRRGRRGRAPPERRRAVGVERRPSARRPRHRRSSPTPADHRSTAPRRRPRTSGTLGPASMPAARASSGRAGPRASTRAATEDGYTGNGTSVVARDPQDIVDALLPSAAPTESVYATPLPVPQHALEADYAYRPTGAHGVGLVLEFADAAAADALRAASTPPRCAAARAGAGGTMVVTRRSGPGRGAVREPCRSTRWQRDDLARARRARGPRRTPDRGGGGVARRCALVGRSLADLPPAT